MAEVQSKVPIRDAYGTFIQGLIEKDPLILGDGQIRQRLEITRNPYATDKQKAKARNDIIDSSLRLIPYVIKGLPSTDVRQEELIGQAFEVLDGCIDSFDAKYISPKTEEPPKFSSYFTESLKKSLRGPRDVARVGDAIPTPIQIDGIATYMRRARELFLQEEHREPSQDEWYKRTIKFVGETYSVSTLKSITPETFKATNRAKLTGFARLGRRISGGSVHADTLSPATGTIEESLADEAENTEGTAIENIIKEETEEELQKSLDSLKASERTVLELAFGIGLNEDGRPKDPLPQSKIAEMLGVPKEKVTKYMATGLRKLRHPSRTRGLRKNNGYQLDDDYRRNIERITQEGAYRDVVTAVSDDFLRQITHNFDRGFGDLQQVHALALIRNGDESGQIDLGLFEPLPIWPSRLESLKEYEEKLSTSPIILARDIVEALNWKIENFNRRIAYRGVSLIDIDDVIKESKKIKAESAAKLT